MSQVINTNVLSLTAQRNLQSSQSELATSLQRLSSGLRINSAKDDAAGLAISERFTTQIRGLNQAIRNSNDGISLSQTGEAALDTVTENLQRIRELAVQSVNATNSDTDRATLQQEVEQRLSEIDRIAGQTSFNGRNVLDGSFGNALFQVGANVGETIGLTLDSSVRTGDIGSVAKAESVDLDTITGQTVALGAFTDGASDTGETSTLTVTLAAGDDTLSFSAESDNAAALDEADLASELATAFGGSVADGDEANGFTVNFGGEATAEDAITAGSLSFSRGDNTNFSVTQSVSGDDFDTAAGFDGGDLAALATGENDTDSTQQAIIVDNSGTGEAFTFTLGDGSALAVADGTYNTATEFVDAINAALGSNATASLDANNVLSITTGQNIQIDQSGLFDNASSPAQQDVFGSSLYTVGGSLNLVDVSSDTGANDAIGRVDAALTSVSELRSTFGAIQNRFESTIENLTTTSENLQASRSRILDADFAQETANLTRAQILQQAGISVLSQANVQPQNVLALLQ